MTHTLAAELRDLVCRLRGEYRIPITDGLGSAGGEEPDNPREFVRRFETPPIQHEAADAIDRLTRELGEAKAAEKSANGWYAKLERECQEVRRSLKEAEAALSAARAELAARRNKALEEANKAALDYGADETAGHSNRAVQHNTALGIANAIRALQASGAAVQVPDSILIGGNHLASALVLRVGPDFSTKYPPDSEPEYVLRMLGATPEYDMWCCWSAIKLSAAPQKQGA